MSRKITTRCISILFNSQALLSWAASDEEEQGRRYATDSKPPPTMLVGEVLLVFVLVGLGVCWVWGVGDDETVRHVRLLIKWET
eukprot:scaffold7169_cov98-Skeletonema_dohrnii-CCMP3373.AAC.1